MADEATLREALVSHLQRTGVLHFSSAATAMRAVPRHRFIPAASLDEAYADRAIAIKMRGDEIVSSISQPGMIAQMLELLDAAAGDRVLEVGTGSGYNAALLAEIVGPNGSVTTIDLDGELVDRARALLCDCGYANIDVVAADGVREVVERERYDRIIVTARTDDVADAWWQGLQQGARLVVPLRLEGVGEYAVGFVRRGSRLISVGAHPCAFIALRSEVAAPVAGEVFYRDPGQRSSPACVRQVRSVIAVRRADATTVLLDEADIVIARPTTIFAVTFRSL
jgi:protein-L-isoaspartate(D-aspartate) O-methyltransferase